LTGAARARLFDEIVGVCEVWSIGFREPEEIDRINIQEASLAAMRDAVAGLTPLPDFVLVDAFRIPGISVPQRGVVGGDRLCACIAAASILAKVTRDRLMTRLHDADPRYGFHRHKGYATPEHLAAMAQHGYSTAHRRSFRPKLLLDAIG
jgi:ribonuclease HII